VRIAVEVWCIDLVDAPPPSASGLDMLSADERARHARYLVAEPARIFATTRIALRRLLGRRLGQQAAAVRIEADSRGKPVVVDEPQAFFNVSHGSSCALIAFCDVSPVGVDVEKRTALAFEGPMAASICAPAERAWMQANAAFADVALTRLWIRKEAVLKASGIGLTRPVSELDLGIPAATEGILAAPHLGRVAWRDLALTQAALGAVAVRSDDASVIDVTQRSYAA
jgi:4'-phosphopantetheinyl transferase